MSGFLSFLWPFGRTGSRSEQEAESSPVTDTPATESTEPPPEPIRFVGRQPREGGERLRQWMEDALAGYFERRIDVPMPPSFSNEQQSLLARRGFVLLFAPNASVGPSPRGAHLHFNSFISPERDIEHIPLAGQWMGLETIPEDRMGRVHTGKVDGDWLREPCSLRVNRHLTHVVLERVSSHVVTPFAYPRRQCPAAVG